jgi:hypothetical protein
MPKPSTTRRSPRRTGANPDPRKGWRSLRLPFALGVVCLLANLLLLPRFRHDCNPDAIAYIGVARKIVAGDLHGAINGYWGPLFSWLLAPLLAMGLEPLLAARLLAVAMCVPASFAAWRLSLWVTLSPWLRAALLLAMLPALVNLTCREITPDLLLVAVLLFYLDQLIRPTFGRHWRSGVVCGLLGALAYLTKAYGFYFFLVHFSVACVATAVSRHSAAERRRVGRVAILGLAVFLGLSGLWVAALASKYGHPSLGTAGPYNRALAAPGASVHPMNRLGFLPPVDDTAVSAWDDPSFLPLPQSRPLATGETTPGRLAMTGKNLKLILDLAIGYCPLTPLIIMIGLSTSLRGFLRPRRVGPPRASLWVPLSAVLIYCAGYALLIVEWRYVFLVCVLLPLIGADLLCVEGRRWRDRFIAGMPRGRVPAAVLGVALVGLLLVPLARKPAKLLRGYYRDDWGPAAHALAVRLRGQVPPGARIASNQDWGPTLLIAFELDARYFGEQGESPLASVPQELRALGVTHYFVWRETPEEAALMNDQTVGVHDRTDDLTVYRLQP